MSEVEPLNISSDEEVSSSTTPQPDPKKSTLYDSYEDKTDEVKKQFVVLKENLYINRLKNVYSASNEFMTCDCTEEIEDGYNIACGLTSDCINRLTNIECVDDQCSCGVNCLNQRFQKRDNADTSIFLTQEKGYGMRANKDIPAHTFIIEYMGEIVDNEEYKVRKELYDEQGIKHFYFMMIKDNEIIDASKRASLGRYCNHSCDPNAYVEKWVVNKRFRMGIFAKRNILKGEEICFDYNVDRYGAEPQKCYCGAANCLGIMGGKTQSENARLLPHAITEALGVKASDEKKWIKAQRKNGVKITKDNIDSNVNVEFVKSLELSPLTVEEVAKVASCLMQPGLDFLVIHRILERFFIDTSNFDELITRLNRLHGLQALGLTLKDVLANTKNESSFNDFETELISMIIKMFKNWPELKSRNSILNSNLDESLEKIENKIDNDKIIKSIKSILSSWEGLEVVYRIPKKMDNNETKTIINDRRNKSSENVTPVPKLKLPTKPAAHKTKPWGELDVMSLPENRRIGDYPLPTGWEWAADEQTGNKYFYHRAKNITTWERPEWPVIESPDIPGVVSFRDEEERRRRKEREKEREQKRIIELERERALMKRNELKVEEERVNMLSSIIAQASTSVHDSDEEKQKKANKKIKEREKSKEKKKEHTDPVEAKWTVLFASIVPNMLKKYDGEIGRDNLKNCARDIVHQLAQKEMKRHKDEIIPAALSEDRKAKVKKFTKDYMHRFMAKYQEKKNKRKLPSRPSASSEKKVKH